MKLQKTLNMIDIKKDLEIMMYKFFHKKTGLDMSVNQELAPELRKAVVKNFKTEIVYARFKG